MVNVGSRQKVINADRVMLDSPCNLLLVLAEPYHAVDIIRVGAFSASPGCLE